MTPKRFGATVLEWFEHHGRKDLPWQQNPTPYRVWVSEIMLQQTQVTKVIPYFQRFIQRFPDLETLAKAPMDEVLEYWSGLGYYARARNLHKAARLIKDRYKGQMPLTTEALRALPGIGRSTAGAILSLSKNQPQAILDGNVKRVLARCFAVPGWPGQNSVANRLWALSEQLTPPCKTADYNQALMDLGATVCTRVRPGCAACPLAKTCAAHADGNETDYPSPRPRRLIPLRSTRLLLVHAGGSDILLEKRPPAGIWGGLWSLPECPPDLDIKAWCREHLGLPAATMHRWPSRRHTFSHFHLDIRPVEILLENRGFGVMDAGERVWYKLNETDRCALAAPVARLLSDFRLKYERKTS